MTSIKTKTTTSTTKLKLYIWIISLIWTIVIAVSLVFDLLHSNEHAFEMLYIQASIVYDSDILFRRWNTEHSRVYVPITEKTPPNPYLLGIVPERDISTPSGKKLTLMNPAYMTRQVHELLKEKKGIQGHITSLKPVQPENKADPWETKALQAFEKGESEVVSIEKMDGQDYLRLMRPLVTEKDCLKCHEKQGYKEGDIRGGISISIPTVLTMQAEEVFTTSILWTHFILFLFGIGGIAAGGLWLIKSDQKRVKVEEETAALKDKFVSMVSHEVRSPLAIMKGFVEILENNKADPISDKQKYFLEKIVKQISKLNNLTNDVLDVEKMKAGKMPLTLSENDINELVESVSQNAKIVVEKKGLILTNNLDNTIPKINFDINRIEQVLLNLLNNALIFTEKGQISIETKKIDNTVQVSVKDTGLGIKKESFDKIFCEFEQVRGMKKGGTGLGLSIVKDIVELHNGKIWVESEFGKGTVFYFILPIT